MLVRVFKRVLMTVGASAMITMILVLLTFNTNRETATGDVVDAKVWDTEAPQMKLIGKVAFVNTAEYDLDNIVVVNDQSEVTTEMKYFKKIADDANIDEYKAYQYVDLLSKNQNADLIDEYVAYKDAEMTEAGVYLAVVVSKDTAHNLTAKPVIVVYNPN